MMLLGAGASAGFGIPTMKELTTECYRILETEGFPSDELEAVKSSLTTYGFVADFEALLTILDALANPMSATKSLGAFGAYLANKLGPLKQNDVAARSVRSLKDLLIEKCQQAKNSEAAETYNLLFESLAKTRSPPWTSVTVEGKPDRKIPDIFALNYDLVIEHYFEHEQIADYLRTGFVQHGMRMHWSPDSPSGHSWERFVMGQRYVNLVKLHGSIDQFVTRESIEKRQAHPGSGFYKSEIEEEMMVFPVTEKYSMRGPYAELFTLFRKRLRVEPVCIVIGYSFRDEAANAAFLDAFKTNRKLKIVYICGDETKMNLSHVPEIATRTFPIERRFGVDRETIAELTNSITNST